MKLSTYIAVEILRREEHHDVAEAVLREAAACGISFYHLEMLDRMTVGTRSLLRFRGDLPLSSKLSDRLLAKGRTVIDLMADGYVVRVPGGRKSTLPYSTMLAAPRSPKLYRGTASPLWEQQFAAAAVSAG